MGCRFSNSRTGSLAVVCALANVLLAGCQTPALTVEEAKQVTATFAGKPFVPPPRTINDITAILNQYKPEPDAAEKVLAVANQQPPVTDDPAQLAKFYYKRGVAAGRIGHNRQQIEDLKLAIEHARQTRNLDEGVMLFDLSVAEGTAGLVRQAEVHREEAIRKGGNGQRMSWRAALAMMQANNGNLEAARQTLAQADLLLGGLQQRPGWNTWGYSWSTNVEHARGSVMRAAGKYAESEQALRASIEHELKDREIPKPPENTLAAARELRYLHILMELSRTLAAQGRPVEAEVEARKALTLALSMRGRYSLDTAYFLKGLTEAIFEQGRYAEAERLARAGIDIYRALGVVSNSRTYAGSRMQLAAALLAERRWSEALAEFEGVRSDLEADPESLQVMFMGNIDWPLALIKTDHASQALDSARRVVERRTSIFGEDHYNTTVAHGVYAMALAEGGDKSLALVEFGRAIPVLLAHSRQTEEGSATAVAKLQRLQMILEAYIDLLSEVRGTDLERRAGVDAAGEAFRVADAMHGQSVQRAVGASAARAAAKDPALADLVRREQDASQQITALYGSLTNMLSLPPDQQDAKATTSLREQISRLEAARASLAAEIGKTFPQYAQFVDPRPATLSEAQNSLLAGEALIAISTTEKKTLMWAVPQHGAPAFASTPLGEKQIGRMVTALRRALDPDAAILGDIPAFDIGLAHQLYAALLQPVEDGWRNAKALVIVVHGALAELPFSLLPMREAKLGPESGLLFSNYRQVPWLARRVAVAQVPSVALLAVLRALPQPDPKRMPFMGFGDPQFSSDQQRTEGSGIQERTASAQLATRGLAVHLRSQAKSDLLDSATLAQLPRLPDTADELRTIALVLKADPQRDVLTGSRATVQAVKSANLASRRVLMFATHGLAPGDLDGLTQPALALSPPEVAGSEAGNGVLSVDDILGLKLDADWVVLSACNTAAGNGAGAEAVSGLGRAFFYAGTRALLVSNWSVETTSARELTTRLFRYQAEDPMLTRAEALRRAMLDLVDGTGYVDPATGKAVFSYAHPIFWAPFSLVGDGGG